MIASAPLAAFADLFARAVDSAPPPPADPTAAALATADPQARPSVRIVLVRQFDDRGFVFYTNYDSRKGQTIANPRAALCFYWFWLEEQVRIEGAVSPVTPEESDEYFAGRPRGSQIGAWASDQSRVLASRRALEDRYHDFEARFTNSDVPRPPHWGGFRLSPVRVEFWKAGAYRLHDRLVYHREGDGWLREALYP